jgi:PAS domain S-box-containing protein
VQSFKRNTILNQLSIQQIVESYNLLPDILFWIKDRNSNIVYANQILVEHLGFKNLEQLQGKNDTDFAPMDLAKQFIEDDKKVMKGELVTNRLELNILNSGEIAWFSTSKRPLTDDDGNIVGTYGLTRHMNKTSKELSNVKDLDIPINYIKNNYQNDISILDLADVSHLSISALERRFNKHLKKTPKRFINEFRLERARKLIIETDMSISQIAFQTGFTEPSYFTKLYKNLFGNLPSELRQKQK